jgi:hypothetical protein
MTYEGKITPHSIAVISNCNSHNTVAVHSFLATSFKSRERVMFNCAKRFYTSRTVLHRSTKITKILPTSFIISKTLICMQDGTFSLRLMERVHVTGLVEPLKDWRDEKVFKV